MAETAVIILAVNQVQQSELNGATMISFFVRLSCAQERQQCQCRGTIADGRTDARVPTTFAVAALQRKIP